MSRGWPHGKPRKDIMERFWRLAMPEPNTGCWFWLGALALNGYGRFKISGVTFGAHRAAYILFKGPIEEGRFVCHRCDTPSCVNPDHLWLGTPTDNVLDAIAKDRGFVGIKNGRAKLSEKDVKDIRRLRTVMSQAELARATGIAPTTLFNIFHRKTWKHVI